VCVLVACQGGGAPGKGSAAGSAARDPWGATDPWAGAPPSADDPPSLFERHKLADEACPTVKAPFFFRVEKDGHTNYLLGTYHIGVPFSKFPAVVHDTLHQAKLVMFELPPSTRPPRLNQGKISIRDALGPELWKHYRELVGSAAADMNERASPMLASLQLALMYDDPSAMLEEQIQADLRPLNIPMDGLETEDFQLEVLAKLFDVRLLRAIVATTKDRAELRDEKVHTLHDYCAGTSSEEIFDEHERKAMHDVGYTDADLAAFEDQLLYSRNAAWIPKLEDLFGQGGVVVAVGAGHLRGPRGVPALLEGRGYKVTRVTPP